MFGLGDRHSGRGGGHGRFRDARDRFPARGGDGPWGEHGRGRARRVIDGGELRLVLLRLIGDEPRHGYELIKAIEELTGGGYAPSPGMVYPALAMLAEMALIDEAAAAGARKRFAATDEGRAHLDEHRDTVEALMTRLAALGSEAGRVERGPVRRSFHNLRMAVRERLAGPDVSPDTLHAVAALIDEVAQKVEKLK